MFLESMCSGCWQNQIPTHKDPIEALPDLQLLQSYKLQRLSHTPQPVSVEKIDMRTMHIDIPINIGMSYEIHFDLTTSNCLC